MLFQLNFMNVPNTDLCEKKLQMCIDYTKKSFSIEFVILFMLLEFAMIISIMGILYQKLKKVK